MPAQTEMRAAWDAMRPVQQKIMSGDLSPQDGVEIMQQSALEKLASLKK
jgi:arabinogalactan oligomer / maltooligosaccharide transport system substrate-binding protein